MKNKENKSRKQQVSDYRELTVEELRTVVKDTSEELLKLRVQHSTRQLKNPARLGQLKKTIARVNTILNEKTTGEAAA